MQQQILHKTNPTENLLVLIYEDESICQSLQQCIIFDKFILF